jgi:hypothetical protein
MMSVHLVRHPGDPCAAVRAITVDVSCKGGTTGFTFRIFGTPTAIVVPPMTAPERTNDLWMSTCVEVFVRAPGAAEYSEFNFAPSTAWAAYHFSDYRMGHRDAHLAPPQIVTTTTPECITIDATLNTVFGSCAIGLSAVIEENNGDKSHWALAHPPGKADFHHPDCFALPLKAEDVS